MFDSLASCSCRSTPPTVSSSSSRRDRARSPRRRRRGRSSRSSAPATLARSLLGDVVEGDAELLGRRGVGLASENAGQTAIEEAELVVLDLERPGSRSRDRICEIGAVRIRALEVVESFETLVRPGTLLGARRPAHRHPPVGPARSAAPGDRPARLPRVRRRMRRWRAQRAVRPRVPRPGGRTADRSPRRGAGGRRSARGILQARSARFSLLQLAHFFGTSARVTEALPDALATAEILVALLGLAQERGRGPRGRPRARGAARSTAARETVADGGAPSSPGVYLFHDRNDAVLYVGKAGTPRARLLVLLGRPPASLRRGGARGARADRVAPARVGARGCSRGAALIRELRPPANARGRSDRSAYLERRGERWAVVTVPGPYGPFRSKRRLQLARALEGFEGDEPADAPRAARKAPPARPRPALRGCRSRPRPARGPRGGGRSHRDARAAPEDRALRPRARAGAGLRRAFFVAAGRIAAARTLAPRVPGGSRWRRASQRRPAEPSYAPEDADDLLVLAGFLRRPGPELRIVALDAAEILAA